MQKTPGQVGYEAMLERYRLTHPAYTADSKFRPEGISDEEYQSALDYLAGKWEEQPQGLRDDWEAVGQAIVASIFDR